MNTLLNTIQNELNKDNKIIYSRFYPNYNGSSSVVSPELVIIFNNKLCIQAGSVRIPGAGSSTVNLLVPYVPSINNTFSGYYVNSNFSNTTVALYGEPICVINKTQNSFMLDTNNATYESNADYIAIGMANI